MKLNLGCGSDYRDGWVNVDKGVCKKDIDHDLEVLPLPFGDSVAVRIEMIHVFEHLPRNRFVAFMRELHRVCRPDGSIYLECPYYLSRNAFADFTHQNFMTEKSFDYFDPNKSLRREGTIYGIDFEFHVEVKLNADRLNPDVSIYYQLIPIKTQ